MRTLFTLIFGLVLGAAGGIFADRTAPTKDMIDPFFEASGTSVRVPIIDEGATVPAEFLAEHAIDSCFPRTTDIEVTERPWLDRILGTGGQFDPVLYDAPDLSIHPGLIKIEGIRSTLGSEREHCAAVRISKHWFMTAAHCIIDLNSETVRPTYDIIAVTPSTDDRSEGTQVEPLRGALCHSAYKWNAQQRPNDIALFFLDNVEAFSDVVIAELETADMDLTTNDFTQAYIAGWGKNGGSRYLQGASVNIDVIGEALIGAKPGIPSGATEPRGPNQGDSGAPLYIQREAPLAPLVVGTLSSVTEGATDSSYVRTKSIKRWVDRTIAICEQNGKYVCG